MMMIIVYYYYDIEVHNIYNCDLIICIYDVNMKSKRNNVNVCRTKAFDNRNSKTK